MSAQAAVATARRAAHQPLAALLAGMAEKVPDLNVSGVQLDSRRVQPGDLFLACKGLRDHGLKFAEQAQQQGAAAVAWEPDTDLRKIELKVPAVAVPALARRAGEIASRYYQSPSERLFVAGITGTDGKTSTAYLLAQALDLLGKNCGYLGTLGAGRTQALQRGDFTTPDAVALQATLAGFVDQGMHAAAMEVSSHALDQARVGGVSFDVAVLTNIGRDHLDYHGDEHRYAAAKHLLFRWPGLRAALLNRDDAHGSAWAHELDASVDCVLYGVDGLAPHGNRYLLARDLHCGAAGLQFKLDSSWGKAEVQAALLGRFNAYNLLAVLGVLLESGVAMSDAVALLGKLQSVPGRMERLSLPNGASAVIDYAHTPQALQQALKACRAHAGGRLICVFGCGGDRDRGKRPQMGAAAAAGAELCIVTDDNPRGEAPSQITEEILAGMSGHAATVVIHDRAEAIARGVELAGADDLLLIAGKGHEDYQLRGDQRLHFSDREQLLALGAGAPA